MIVAFVGDNGQAREQAAKEFIAGFVSVHGATAVDRFNAESLEIGQLIDAISTTPFLSPRRMVTLRDLSVNKHLVEHLEEIVNNTADTTDLVIIEEHIDGRSKYLTELKKLAEVREFANLDGEALVSWVIAQANLLGGSINYETAEALIDRVGTNHQLLANELAKLVLYQPKISNMTIQLLTTYSPQSSIFAMLDAAFAGDTSKALKLYTEQRTQGMEPQAILGMITWQLHALALVKTAGTLPQQEIASKAKLSPFVVRKNQTNAKNISEQKLISLIRQAIKVDKQIKTTKVNPDDSVQSLIMAFV
jgi:DNA polymerase-3 subunit delta